MSMKKPTASDPSRDVPLQDPDVFLFLCKTTQAVGADFGTEQREILVLTTAYHHK